MKEKPTIINEYEYLRIKNNAITLGFVLTDKSDNEEIFKTKVFGFKLKKIITGYEYTYTKNPEKLILKGDINEKQSI